MRKLKNIQLFSGFFFKTELFFFFFLSVVCAEKVEYQLFDEPIDVVIPCAKKDLRTLELCIEGVRKNVARLGEIIVISKERYTDNADWFAEELFPFSKFDLGYYICGETEDGAEKFLAECTRVGWIYQQFLKLYAPFVIPGISSNVLIVDADVIFYQPASFLNAKNEGLYNPGREYHKPYFNQMKRLLPDLHKLSPKYSGISHHMLFQRSILEDLFSTIEDYHEMDMWKALCKTIDPREINTPCISEYEIYFNFVFSKTSQVKIRPLKWTNKWDLSPKARNADLKKGYHYVAYHEY
jgi:hypothetical protein